jgi:hypothetical protein
LLQRVKIEVHTKTVVCKIQSKACTVLRGVTGKGEMWLVRKENANIGGGWNGFITCLLTQCKATRLVHCNCNQCWISGDKDKCTANF